MRTFKISLIAAAALTAVSAPALADGAIDRADIATIHANQAADRARVAQIVDTANAYGLPVLAVAHADKVNAKQAQQRAHIAKLVDDAHKLSVSPVFMAQLERIQLRQAQNRAQVAKQRNMDPAVEFDG